MIFKDQQPSQVSLDNGHKQIVHIWVWVTVQLAIMYIYSGDSPTSGNYSNFLAGFKIKKPAILRLYSVLKSDQLCNIQYLLQV